MIGRLHNIVLDCPDPPRLAAFYAAILGWPILRSEHDWWTVGEATGARLCFQLAPDHVPALWPDPGRPQQLHLDIVVDDIDAGEAVVLGLGATRLPGGEEDFRVYADPAGHPFCLEFGDAVVAGFPAR